MILAFAFTALLVLLVIILSVILATRLYDQSQQVERLRRALYPVSLRGNWRVDAGREHGACRWTGIPKALALAVSAKDALDGWTPPELEVK